MAESTVPAREKLQETLLLLAHWAKKANEEEGLDTTVVAVIQKPSGEGVANVYANGKLEESPWEMGVKAEHASAKVRLFAMAVNRGQIKAEARG